jgi:hypothetical protein
MHSNEIDLPHLTQRTSVMVSVGGREVWRENELGINGVV